ncbi:hypothetical protein QBC39DRAFT_267049 [Podospora conica]|nr:hypothetical protein QBC39DRAFT_267049 [Schizothecium conicum]
MSTTSTPQSVRLRHTLQSTYPWTASPLIVSAPMRVLTGPSLAHAVLRAGGLPFIGPGLTPSWTYTDLSAFAALLPTPPPAGELLPVGIAFQLWTSSLPDAIAAITAHPPAAAWLFAPRNGQAEVDEWTVALRAASPGTQIWLQVGTLTEAVDAVVRSSTPPDVLVVQGAEAGGHGRVKDGSGFITLLPEIADALADAGRGDVPLVAAGGIVDGRGVVGALGVGAAAAAMGTRFLAAREARIAKGYQDEVVRARDGGSNTVRTQLWNHLRGTFGWPEAWSPRGVINRSWVEQQEGVGFEELQKRHDAVVKKGDEAWGPEGRTATYAGAGVGLVKKVMGAGEIVEEVRGEAKDIIAALHGLV